MADQSTKAPAEQELPDYVRRELEAMTATDRAAVIMLLMGEAQAAERPH